MNCEPNKEDDATDNGEASTTQDKAKTESANTSGGAKEPGQDVQYENDTIRKSIR